MCAAPFAICPTSPIDPTMSLINEALKKAQRQRHEEQAELSAPMPGGGTRVARRAKSLPTQTIVLLAGGGIALFVLCVVGAVLWINRPAPPRAKPAPVAVAPSAAPAPVSTPPPIVLAPVPAEAKPTPAVATPTTVVTPQKPEPTAPAVAAPEPKISMASARSAPAVELANTTSAEPATSAPARIITVPNLPAAKFEERIQAIVDSWRVAGIRSSATGSRVLLNERVYKLNDVVDRTNGLRLSKIAADQLTFTTSEGIDYVKTF